MNNPQKTVNSQKNNQLIIIIGSILLFVGGFILGSIIRNTTYNDAREEFRGQIDDLKNDLQQAEFLNRKLKVVFKTVEEKNEEIKEKDVVIREKEAEVNRLAQRIAKSVNPEKIRTLAAQLNKKNTELAQLRKEYNKVFQEAKRAQNDLEEANKILKEKNERITALNNELAKKNEKDVDHYKKELKDIKKQITDYQNGSLYEFRADNYKGKKKRLRKDQLYHSAYYHYSLAGAEYDKKRIYSKIRSKDIKRKIDNNAVVEAP